MPRKKAVKDPQEEIEATCKLLCDEAANHMKVRNYTKALNVYQKVKQICEKLQSFFYQMSFDISRNIRTCNRLIPATDLNVLFYIPLIAFPIWLMSPNFRFRHCQHLLCSRYHRFFMIYDKFRCIESSKAQFVSNANNSIVPHAKIKIDSQSTRCHSRPNWKVFVFILRTNRMTYWKHYKKHIFTLLFDWRNWSPLCSVLW